GVLPTAAVLKLPGFAAVRAVVPAGDYDLDGAVTIADDDFWRANYGSTDFLEADGDGNGVVDAADYALWVSGFGGGSASTAVPEPVSLVLAGGAGVVALATRRRR
ncbi:MAG: hypothetical protein AAFZ07_30010, partial [Actinomycetota bacterium]